MRCEHRQLFLAFLVLLSTSSPGACDEPSGVIPRGVGLRSGMSTKEILSRWGAPRERVEMETKREEFWIYAGAKLLIADGKLVRGDRVDVSLGQQQVEVSAKPHRGFPKRMQKVSDETVGEILTELKTYGSDSPGSSGDNPPPPAFQPPGLPPGAGMVGERPPSLAHVP